VRGTERIRRTVEPRDEPVALLRKGEHLERRLDDHAEGPKRSDEELVEVVSRDVLDDASTRARDRSVRESGAGPDEKIAHPAVAGSPETIRVRGNDPSDRRGVRVRRVER